LKKINQKEGKERKEKEFNDFTQNAMTYDTSIPLDKKDFELVCQMGI